MRVLPILLSLATLPAQANTHCLLDGGRVVGRAGFATTTDATTRTEREQWTLFIRGARNEGDLTVSTIVVRDAAGIRSVTREVAAGRVPERVSGQRTPDGWRWQLQTGAQETVEHAEPPHDDGPIDTPGMTARRWFDPLDLDTRTFVHDAGTWSSEEQRRAFLRTGSVLATGRVVLFERTFNVVPCSPEEARRRRRTIDPLASGGWSLPVAIDAPLLGSRLGYELTGFPGPPAITPSAEQQWRLHGDRLRLRVCADCANEPDDAIDPAWTRSNAFVDSDDPSVRKQAALLRRDDPADTARAITRFVKRHLWQETDELGYASASQALRDRRGNCSEHAVLLAALARANGIPARIVFGLVHHRERRDHSDRLLPHAWVQVHVDGRWQSVDAAQDRGFSAGHIALMLGDGDPHAVNAALSQWRRVQVQRVVRFE